MDALFVMSPETSRPLASGAETAESNRNCSWQDLLCGKPSPIESGYLQRIGVPRFLHSGLSAQLFLVRELCGRISRIPILCDVASRMLTSPAHHIPRAYPSLAQNSRIPITRGTQYVLPAGQREAPFSRSAWWNSYEHGLHCRPVSIEGSSRSLRSRLKPF